MKKLFILIALIIIIFLTFIVIKQLNAPKYSTGAGVYETTIVNDNGEYVLENSTYSVGSDIPYGKYKVVSKTDTVDIKLVTSEGLDDLSSIKVGDKVKLSSDYSAIIVSGGSVNLK